MDIATISVLIPSITQGLANLREFLPKNQKEIDTLQEKITSLAGKIYELQTENLQLRDQMIELKRQTDKEAKWEEEKSKYEVYHFPNERIVYILSEERDNPKNFYCQNCFDAKNQIIHLQPLSCASGHKEFACSSCKNKFVIQNHDPSFFNSNPHQSDLWTGKYW